MRHQRGLRYSVMRLITPPLARGVTTLHDDDDPATLVADPLLHLHQLLLEVQEGFVVHTVAGHRTILANGPGPEVVHPSGLRITSGTRPTAQPPSSVSACGPTDTLTVRRRPSRSGRGGAGDSSPRWRMVRRSAPQLRQAADDDALPRRVRLRIRADDTLPRTPRLPINKGWSDAAAGPDR